MILIPSFRRIVFAGLLTAFAAAPATHVHADAGEAFNTRLLGHHDLGGRSAYQPWIKKQDGRYIAYVGHHGGGDAGTSILDVTGPTKPVLLSHVPARGGAQMVQACRGDELPNADKNKTYMLRTNGTRAHEIWDVSDPAKPSFLVTVVGGLSETHKNWWECDTGIAYLVADLGPDGWDTNRGMKIFDLSNPAKPKFIRNFGLIGSEPGGKGSGDASARIHESTSHGGKVFVAYGTGWHGAVQILDRKKLLDAYSLKDPRAPTRRELLAPQLGRLDMPTYWGGHTAWPLLDVAIPDFAFHRGGSPRDFVVLVSETNDNGCTETMHHMAWFLDITEPAKPFPVANFHVPEAAGKFCRRGGRFGTHSVSWAIDTPLYGKIAAFSYFNAGMRAVDVRNPYRPREIAYYIPAPNKHTARRCDSRNGCRRVAQTNNVEIDGRGLIYLADRAGGGLHIVELTGKAAAIITKK
ncbi:MAG: hypothetical protein RIB59_00060 [Rhodospirillales bacterium]